MSCRWLRTPRTKICSETVSRSCGLSKSGFGAVTLPFRNPIVFNAAAAWDFPAEQPDTNDFAMIDNYGTEANFQSNYRPTDAWLAAPKAPFQTATRLWLSHDAVTFAGTPTFLDEVNVFAGRLQANGVQFMRTGGAMRTHSWTSGWLPEAVASPQELRALPASRPLSTRSSSGSY